MQRLDRLGRRKSKEALVELLAYYRIQAEDRAQREWKEAIEKLNAKKAAQGAGR